MYKNQVRLFKWLMIMKIRLKIKDKLYRYDTNKSRPRHGHKYTKNIVSLSIMIVKCIKQHLSKICSTIYEKLSDTEAELTKSVAYKKACIPKKSIWTIEKMLRMPSNSWVNPFDRNWPHLEYITRIIEIFESICSLNHFWYPVFD